MEERNRFAEEREKLLARRREKQMPQGHRDWFFLRERWNACPDSLRQTVLKVAGIPHNHPLEQYSNTEKRAIATAIVDIHTFAKADGDFIAREKGKWQRLYQANE